jgi:hypothetical protein
MHPQPSGLVAGREAEPPAEVEQDVGGLADDELAGLEERRRKRRALRPPSMNFIIAATPRLPDRRATST